MRCKAGRDFLELQFLALDAGYMYLLRNLIGSLRSLFLFDFWLCDTHLKPALFILYTCFLHAAEGGRTQFTRPLQILLVMLLSAR